MFRNVDDMNYAFNSLCSALYKTDSICLAEAFISTHHHGCYLTSFPRELMHIHRTSYTKYFNNKYGRTGSLGEKGFFMQEIDGLRHQVSAITYVLKNPVHHGISATPFAYPYCSANAFFRKDLGKDFSPRLLTSEQIRMSLPRRAEFDPSWKMGTEGVFLRESVLETAMVESLYSTPQAFNYMLSRKSGEDWVKEQGMDSVSCPPVTLENIESPLFTGGLGKEDSLFHMMQNERSRFNRSVMTDLILCGIVDMELASGKAPRTVYQLSNEEKICLANELHRRFHCGKEQIRRCLAMNG